MFIEPVEDNFPGRVEIPEEFNELKDRDLAQRLATNFFGEFLAPSQAEKPRPNIQVLDIFSMNTSIGIHEAVAVKVKKYNIHGEPYTYIAHYCAHELYFVDDERFLDDNQKPLVSGNYIENSSYSCPVKELASIAKHRELKNKYLAEEKYSKMGYFKHEKMQDIVYDLLLRYENEWLGISHNGFYVQHLKEILSINLVEANRLVGLLVDQGLVKRSGNVLFTTDKITLPEKPTRLWATYSESGNQRPIFETYLYIPASSDEPEAFRIETYKNDSLYEVIQINTRKPLTSEWLLSETDERYLQYALQERLADWRAPYPSPVKVALQLVEMPEFIKKADTAPVAKDKYPYGHRRLKTSDFGWWSCTVCENSGDEYTSPKDFECIEK